MILANLTRGQIITRSLSIAGLTAAVLIGAILPGRTHPGFTLDFGFLSQPAFFELGDSVFPFKSGDTVSRAFLAGVSNTVSVSALGIVLATVIGVLVGICRLSSSNLLSRGALGYVEIIRNTPLLLQLLFWHTLLTAELPPPRQAVSYYPCIYFTNRGVYWPSLTHAGWLFAAAALMGVSLGAALIWQRSPARWRWPALLAMFLFVVLIGKSLWPSAGPSMFLCPHREAFNIVASLSMSTEFLAVLLALSLYSSSYISEIVRGAIAAVPQGQVEAAKAIGLQRGRTLWLIVLPQALKSMIPPMTSQYLGLMKSSSLAVAVGYPDLVRVSIITVSQTGRAVECMMIVMLVYLSISLPIAIGMNIYNRHRLRKVLV